jgi:hypothetical protein
MKLRKLLFTTFAALIVVNSFAQLSQRTNDPGNFKYGTRPQSGDWGLNFQLYAVGGTNFLSYFKDMPIINVQHYMDNNTALRLGIRASKHKTVFKGNSDSVLFNPDNLSKVKYRESTREYMIYIGLEKHFSLTNILDVYMGGQIPLGFSGDVVDNNQNYLNGDKAYFTTRTNSFLYGIEGFLGLQAFIADLPIAIGAEWGIAGYGRFFDKTLHTADITGLDSQKYYTTGSDPSNTEYSKLSSKKFDMDNMVRFRISYYFNR